MIKQNQIKMRTQFLLYFLLMLPYSVPAQIHGRYIQIMIPGEKKILSLAEVEVFSKNRNIALNKSACQTSTAFNGLAEYAIDGNPSGEFGKKTVSHTHTSTNPTWELDLGKNYNIDKIKIYNRTDGETGKRLNNTVVLILNKEKVVVWEEHLIKALPVHTLKVNPTKHKTFVGKKMNLTSDFLKANKLIEEAGTLENQNTHKANLLYSNALQLMPENGTFNYKYGFFLYKTVKNYAKAMDYFEKATLLLPKDKNAKIMLGNAKLMSFINAEKKIAYHNQKGDSLWYYKNYNDAYTEYNHALNFYNSIPNSEIEKRAESYFENMKNNETIKDYTILTSSFNPINYKRNHYLVGIDTKIETLRHKPVKKPGSLVLNVGLVVINEIDCDYIQDNETFRETSKMDSATLLKHKITWQWIETWINYFTLGEVMINSTWYNCPATLKKIKYGNYGTFTTQYIDLMSLSPYPNELFKTVAQDNDMVVFCIKSEKAATSVLASFIRLKSYDKNQKWQGCILKLPSNTNGALHEFLHLVEKPGGAVDNNLLVHGARPADRFPNDFNGGTLDWYFYIIQHIDWTKVKNNQGKNNSYTLP